MKSKRRVDLAANKLTSNNKANLLTPIFKRFILKKFKNLNIGFIKLIDEDTVYYFGNKTSLLKANVQVLSSDFYFILGTRGLLGVAECYANGLWKSDDLVILLRIIMKNAQLMNQLETIWSKLLKPINYLIHWNRKNSISGSKKNIVAHYDLSNEFYKLWLDETMTYSCGIFKNNTTTLKDASIEKLDRICRKLNLNENDSVLEIGSGWGSFSIYAAQNYGCNITTTTISDAQYELTKKRIYKAGLENQITLLKNDYRNLKGKYDKIVSIEMIEAVGHEYISIYFKKISDLLKQNGVFALQGITYNDQNFDTYKNSVDFIKKYIFPGSCLISISQIINTMKEYTDFSIVHLEDITKHYVTTLEMWHANFLKEISKVKKLGFSNQFIKLWEFYFVYCQAGFSERNIGDYQFIFTKPSLSNIKIKY